jgi:fructose-1,6-bisphosphatase
MLAGYHRKVDTKRKMAVHPAPCEISWAMAGTRIGESSPLMAKTGMTIFDRFFIERQKSPVNSKFFSKNKVYDQISAKMAPFTPCEEVE